jgi:DNA-binding winged helix-turn-helix (wHTH) protein/TolB-like protein
MRCRVGDYAFDTETGDLSRDDTVTRLRPQAAAALALLVERAGELVLRDELQQRMWPDSTVEYDMGLNACISQVRSALGDDADLPKYIETLPRRGYRLIATVTFDRNAARPVPAVGSRLRFGLVAAAGLLIVGFAAVRLLFPARPLTIAVMPFRTTMADSGSDYVEAALFDDLVTRMAGADPRGLRVIERHSSFVLAREGLSPLEVGRRLTADYVVEGSIRATSNGYRASAQLLEVATGTYLWSEAFDRSAAVSVALLDQDIAGSIADAVSVALKRNVAPVEPRMQRSVAARDALARAQWILGQSSPMAPARAGRLAEEALGADSTYGEAWATLAETALRSGDVERAERLLARARQSDADAVRLDLIEGRIELFGHGRPGRAIPLLQRAVDARPDGESLHAYALALAAAGNRGAAIRQARAMLLVDPLSAVAQTDMGWAFYYSGALLEAERSCQVGLELAPHSVGARTCAILAAALRARLSEAAGLLPTLLVGLGAEDSTALRVAGRVASGEHAPLWQWIEDSAIAKSRMQPLDRARVAMLAGRPDGAIRELEAAAQSGQTAILFVSVDPAFLPLRTRPDFRSIVDTP